MEVKTLAIFFYRNRRGIIMYNRKMVLTEKIDNFDLKETKKKVNNYFSSLEELELEQARLNAGKGLIAKYDASTRQKRQPYIQVGKDEFNVSAKEEKEAELVKRLSAYYWAKSILSKDEQLYITEYFVNGKYEDEIVGLLGLNNSDSRAFRNLKRRAVYKFAYVLNLLA